MWSTDVARAAEASVAIDCPVCEAPCDSAPIYRYTAAQAASHFCPITRDADRYRRLHACIRRLWGGDACVVVRCATCGFGFGVPFVGGDEEFYSILHEQQGYPSWRWDYDVAIDEAISHRGGGRVLDVGAGVGMFLRRLGPSWQTCATEGSESTRGQLEASGVRVFRSLRDASRDEPGTFDVVTLFQVLEHLADFEPVLEDCRRLLVRDGRLVVTVPDADAMARQERLTGFHDMPPNHINKWTPASLSRVLRRVGFTVGDAIAEPPSWAQLKTCVHATLIAASVRPHSAASGAYRIANKRVRSVALAVLGVPVLVSMLPRMAECRRGGSFALVATCP
jgi:SAM-dependent methyltransferase